MTRPGATADPVRIVDGATATAIARGVTQLRRLGLGPGDRFVVQLGDDLATFGVLAAACLEGVVAVPLPPDLAAGELAALVSDADPVVRLADPTVARVADIGALTTGRQVRTLATGPDDLAALPGTDPSADRPRTRPMAYTSGTTGRRKGVAVGVHDPAWGAEVVDDERDAFDRRHGGRHLVVSPLYHSGPFRFALVTALLGGEVAVTGHGDVARWRRALRSVRPTSTFAAPTQLGRLVAAWEPGDTRGAVDDLASLDLLAHAGAPCPEPTKRALLRSAPEGAVWEFYGSTEGQFTVCPPAAWLDAPTSVGAARPGRRLEIRTDDGRPAAAGTVGTVWCHVPEHARFTYWGAPERTAAVWDGDAFTVGDLGALDEAGRLTLAGRVGDLVLSGGVNVYPAEVERHLLALDGVADAVVFGVPDLDWGERVIAEVVAAPGHRLDADDVRSRVAERVRRAEVPKEIRVVADLPRSATGKVVRPAAEIDAEEHPS